MANAAFKCNAGMMRGVSRDDSSSSSSEQSSLHLAEYPPRSASILGRRIQERRQQKLQRSILDIVSSVVAVVSVAGTVVLTLPSLRSQEGLMYWSTMFEMACGIFFVVEYLVRLVLYRGYWQRYHSSPDGIVDVIVTVLAVLNIVEDILFFSPLDTRQVSTLFGVLSCLRTVRLLKLMKFLDEFNILTEALRIEYRFIFVFLCFVFIVVLILGSLLYAAEHSTNSGFDSIPWGMWWATVTITTVGYGDLVPVTVLGKIVAAMSMLIGYGMLGIPSFLSLSQMLAIPPATSQAIPMDLSGDGEVDSVAVDTTGDGEVDDIVPFVSNALPLPVRSDEKDVTGCLKCASGHNLLRAALDALLTKTSALRIPEERFLATTFTLHEPRREVASELLAQVTWEELEESRVKYS